MGGTVGRKNRTRAASSPFLKYPAGTLPPLMLKYPATEGRDRVSVIINGHDVVRGWAETTTDAALAALFALAREYARIAVENDAMRLHLDLAAKEKRDVDREIKTATARGVEQERARWMAIVDRAAVVRAGHGNNARKNNARKGE